MMMGVIFTSFDDCILGALMEANAVAKKTQHPGGHESGNLTGGWSMAQQILTETDSATIWNKSCGDGIESVRRSNSIPFR